MVMDALAEAKDSLDDLADPLLNPEFAKAKRASERSPPAESPTGEALPRSSANLSHKPGELSYPLRAESDFQPHVQSTATVGFAPRLARGAPPQRALLTFKHQLPLLTGTLNPADRSRNSVLVEESGASMPAGDVLQWADGVVGELRRNLPLIGALRTPGMRDRHWQDLAAATSVFFKPSHEMTYAGIARKYDLWPYLSDIQRVAAGAAREHGLELSLNGKPAKSPAPDVRTHSHVRNLL